MAFTGKATYSTGTTIPASSEDVSDLVGIISPYEVPLLDALGDSLREARCVSHEWLEDELLPNKGKIVDASASLDNELYMEKPDIFRVGDQIQAEGSEELMLVTNLLTDGIGVIRGYAGTEIEEIPNGQVVNILGNAAIEGGETVSRFSMRIRKGNFTCILSEEVEVNSDSMASSQLGLADEMDYQKQEKLRQLLRQLENRVVNGHGTTNGIIQQLTTNVFNTGDEGFPAGTSLDQDKINYALKKIWAESNGSVDLIVVGGYQKRAINGFLGANGDCSDGDRKYSDIVDCYESDLGICRIITSRWMPKDAVLLLDSSRINVLPLAGRSFHFKPTVSTGDRERGELIGEYTLELKNESAHGIIKGLSI